jgi:hypothetical protein
MNEVGVAGNCLGLLDKRLNCLPDKTGRLDERKTKQMKLRFGSWADP